MRRIMMLLTITIMVFMVFIVPNVFAKGEDVAPDPHAPEISISL